MTLPELTGSALDDRWQRLMTRPWAARLWRWGGPAIVLVVAALTRLIGLGHPDVLVFDETYYVKDAWTLMNLGYEAQWPAEADAGFEAGAVDVFHTAPAFVAHPPVGKWIIALGLAAFGAESSFGWRIAVAVCGILVVALTMLLAHLLWRRPVVTVLAGGLLAIDGNAIVMSRVALLDTPLTLLTLLGVVLVVLDRRWTENRLAARVAAQGMSGWGPVLWWRPWLLGAAVALGLAGGVKWSAVYFLAILGVYVVVSEALLRRAAGIEFWAAGGLRQAPVTFLVFVPLAVVVYVTGWAGWFASDGGYHRHWVEEGGEAWTGLLAGVPVGLQNWWHYQTAIYGYHIGETSPHGYQANPLTWPFLVRPTSMYYVTPEPGWSSTILDIANPLIWWAGTAAAVFLVVRVVLRLRQRETVWPEAVVLTGLAAGYLPWLLYLHRTVFQFYTIVFEPYLVLALVAALAVLLGSPGDPEPRRVAGIRTVGVFLIACLAVSAFFWPIWTAADIPYWYFRAHLWLPSWL